MSTKNLSDKEAINKIKEIVDDVKTCIFTTNLENLPLSARPMYAKEVDDDGSIWFLLTNDGDHFREIENDSRVQLFFSATGKSEFISIYGRARIVEDAQRQKELWSDMDNAYFEGPEDQKIAVAKVEPADAYYWDTKNGSLVTLIKMATSAVTGNKKDIGEKGRLNV